MKTTSALAIAAAAGLFLAASPAKAADLGGDCCADLEERVAELEATTVRKGNKKVSVTLYGQVNRALMFWDDGVDSDVYSVDNDVSSTRLGVRGGANFAGDFSMGYNIEFELQNADSNGVSQAADDAGGALAIRHANVSLGHKQFGRLTLGQQSMAGDGIVEIELGGAGVVAGFGTNVAWNQAFRIRRSDTGGNVLAGVGNTAGLPAGANVTWNDTIVELDPTRRDAIRYDSPTIAGFTVSAAWGEDDLADVALRYAEEYTSIGLRVAAGIAYQWGYENDGGDADVNGGSNDSEVIAGSISLLHTPTGLFATFAAATLDAKYAPDDELALDGDRSFWGVRAGIFQKFFSVGKTSIFADYYEAESDRDFDTNNGGVLDAFDVGSSYYGVGLVQNIDDAATELYLMYRNYEVDPSAVDLANGFTGFEDLQQVVAGARIRF